MCGFYGKEKGKGEFPLPLNLYPDESIYVLVTVQTILRIHSLGLSFH